MSDDDGPDGRDAAATRDFPDMEDFPGDGDAERVQLSNVFAGTIEDVGDDELTIDTGADDVVDIAADNDTTVTDTTEVGVDDLAVGDTVRVVGEPSDDDTVEASQITASDDEELLADSAGPGFGGGPHGGERPEIEDLPEGMAEEMPDEIEPRVEGIGPITAGTIESIDGETITVTTEDGDTVTVTTSSSTTVQRVSEISWDDLEAGDEVTVFVDNDGDNLTATAVRRGEDIFVEGLPPRWGPDDDDADSADHPDA